MNAHLFKRLFIGNLLANGECHKDKLFFLLSFFSFSEKIFLFLLTFFAHPSVWEVVKKKTFFKRFFSVVKKRKRKKKYFFLFYFSVRTEEEMGRKKTHIIWMLSTRWISNKGNYTCGNLLNGMIRDTLTHTHTFLGVFFSIFVPSSIRNEYHNRVWFVVDSTTQQPATQARVVLRLCVVERKTNVHD